MKYTVFFVEDEITIREKIRESIDWPATGFEYLGDAADGETALQQILRLKPDIVVTDIKMPHMDGLDLCRGIQYELPDTYVIILSGYNDFEYAQKAINFNVSEYLLKPITPIKLMKSLHDAAQKIEKKRERNTELRDLQKEVMNSRSLRKEQFLQDLMAGINPVDAILQADEFDLNLRSPFYAVSVIHRKNRLNLDDLRQTLHESGFDFPVFRIGYHEAGMIVMAQSTIEMQQLLVKIAAEFDRAQLHSSNSLQIENGQIVDRISKLGESFQHAFSNMNLSQRMIPSGGPADYDENVRSHQKDFDQKVLEDFLDVGLLSDIDTFLESYLMTYFKKAVDHHYLQYLLFNLTYVVKKFLEKYDIAPPTAFYFTSSTGEQPDIPEISEYFKSVITFAISERDQLKSKDESFLNEVQKIIDDEFTEEHISLSMLAQRVNISPAYLSTVFKHKFGMTISQYIIEKRIKKAREYLRTTNMSISDISAGVGYYNANYFSVLFKKQVGLTPREYRNKK